MLRPPAQDSGTGESVAQDWDTGERTGQGGRLVAKVCRRAGKIAKTRLLQQKWAIHDMKINKWPLLAVVAKTAVPSSTRKFFHLTIKLFIDTFNSALYKPLHFLIRTPYLAIMASNEFGGPITWKDIKINSQHCIGQQSPFTNRNGVFYDNFLQWIVSFFFCDCWVIEFTK